MGNHINIVLAFGTILETTPGLIPKFVKLAISPLPGVILCVDILLRSILNLCNGLAQPAANCSNQVAFYMRITSIVDIRVSIGDVDQQSFVLSVP